MLEDLKREVYIANLELPRLGLIKLTWGNVSGYDPERQYFVIKPSGVKYDEMTPEDMVVLDLDCNKIEGKLNPSTDSATHAELYHHFNDIGGVVHTHSSWATVWAQAGRSIPAYGTTHADYFYGEIPCCRELTEDEVKRDYERETGKVIAEHFTRSGLDPNQMKCALLKSHGVFAWGDNPVKAVETAYVLEEIAMMAFYTEQLGNTQPIAPMKQFLLDKHYLRKHGQNSYYGQKK